MTNEELLATAEVELIKLSRRAKAIDVLELQNAIDALKYCIASQDAESIDFARSVLLTEIEELKG